MNKQPLLILCVCFILGIFLQDFFVLPEKTIYILLVVSFLTVFSFLIKNYYFQKLKFYFLGFFFFSLGIFSHFQNSKTPNFPILKIKEMVVFKLNKKLNSNEKNRRYEVSILDIIGFKDKEVLPINSVLSVPKRNKEMDFIHYYKAEFYINKVESPKNDFGFNYRKYLGRKQIFFQSYLPNSYQISKRNDLSFSEKIRQKRLETLHKIDSAKILAKTREFTKGIILADRTEMDNETVQDFSKSGLVHILAISGSHMAIIFWLILLILKPIFPPKFNYFPIVISIAFIWIFAVFIDYGSSVMRSCIMITTYYIYVLLQRKPDLLHSMGLSAMLILVFDTQQLFDVGFQLSFLAVFGIFWLNQPILKYFPKPKNKFQNFFLNIISISISAQMATLPLVVYYFHQYSFVSIVANLVVIPFSEIMIIFALLMTFLLAFSVQFSWLDFIYDFFVTWLLKVIHFFGNLDFAFFKNIPIHLFEVGVLFVLLYFSRFLILHFNLKNILRFSFILLILFALRLFFNINAKQKNEILVHEYLKEKLLSVKEKEKVVFWINENSNKEKIQKSLIDPYLTSRRTNDLEIKFLPKNATSFEFNGKKYDLK